HDRTVAIKVLKPELAEAIGADRFLREIRTTANLSHPHILPLFDSGDADGFLYYVMPFVEGESLQDRLDREGPLPVEDAVQIAREVADALAYAHKKGIIHRDVKPANIMLDEGHALLADFGIAQAKAGAEETKLTGSGMSLGTPSYMSPEQIAGDKEVDGRADQYALGCVLYEMLAGRAPFTGADVQSVMRQHLAADPPSVTQARSSVPAGVAKAIGRALAKAPADRFRTLKEFETVLAEATLPLLARIPMGRARAVAFATAIVLALAAVGVVASSLLQGGPRLSDDLVVVLPFENRTGDARYDAASKRIAETITTRLYQAEVIPVVSAELVATSWGAALERQGRDPSFVSRTAVADQHGAGIVVSGSLASEGDSIRFSAEINGDGGASLIVPVDAVVASSDQAGVGGAIETMTERVAAAVAWFHEVNWTDSTTTKPPHSLAVKDAFDGAWEAWGRGEMEGARLSLERTLELDSTFLMAKILLAQAHMYLGNVREADSLLDETEGLLDPMIPMESLSWKAIRADLDGDWEAGYRINKEASERSPTPLWVLSFGWHALGMNRPREALESMIALDPASADLIVAGHWRYLGDRIAWALHMLGEHRRELREVRRFRELFPDHQWFLINEIRARAARGQIRQAEELVAEAIQKNWSPIPAMRIAGEELDAHGHSEAARTFYERGLAYLEERPVEERDSPQYLVNLFSFLSHLERWDEAQVVAEELVSRNPSNQLFLAFLGGTAAQKGQRAEAQGIDQRLAAMGEGTTHNRACIAAALGEKDRAVELLEQAFQEGWRYSINLHADPSLKPLRGYPPFEEFLRPKG
ncbi:MAG: protein kinase, partial [Gemmatimonadota bacterium]